MKIAGDCPHCKEKIDIDIDKLTLKQKDTELKNTEASQQQTIQEITVPEVKEVVKEKMIIPSHIPGYECSDGNCGNIHPNQNYKKRVKAKCSNCGQFTPNPDKNCPWCNNKEFEELEDDELEELGIPEPENNHHDHE